MYTRQYTDRMFTDVNTNFQKKQKKEPELFFWQGPHVFFFCASTRTFE